MSTTTFSSFKNQQSTNFDRLREELKKTASNGRDNDDRFWQPSRGADGNDYAVIRFLPAGPTEEIPYVKFLSYGFQGPGGWYIEASRSTINEDDDPVDRLRRKLYSTGTEADKKSAQAFRRRTHFISNIEIVDYPKNPELNGKRFFYKYGKKIFDKINDAMNPKFPDEPKIDPFSFWEGADFVLKVTTQDDFPNYDKSEFRKPSPHRGGDDKVLEQIWKELYPLKEFTDPTSKHFKSAEQLQKKLNRVLGLDDEAPVRESKPAEEKGYGSDAARKFEAKVEDKPGAKTTVVEAPKARDDKPWAEDEDELAFFKKAAAGK